MLEKTIEAISMAVKEELSDHEGEIFKVLDRDERVAISDRPEREAELHPGKEGDHPGGEDQRDAGAIVSPGEGGEVRTFPSRE